MQIFYGLNMTLLSLISSFLTFFFLFFLQRPSIPIPIPIPTFQSQSPTCNSQSQSHPSYPPISTLIDHCFARRLPPSFSNSLGPQRLPHIFIELSNSRTLELRLSTLVRPTERVLVLPCWCLESETTNSGQREKGNEQVLACLPRWRWGRAHISSDFRAFFIHHFIFWSPSFIIFAAVLCTHFSPFNSHPIPSI